MTSVRPRDVVILVLAGALTLAILLYGTHRHLVSARENRFDFYPIWFGATTILAGESPYTDRVTREIQVGMFGRELNAWEDQQAFAYPATIAFVLLPVFLLPAPTAITLWASLQIVLVSAAMLWWSRLVEAQLTPPVMAGIIAVGIVGFRYPMINYVLAQFIGFTMFCLVVAAAFLQRRRDAWAGIFLALAAVRPIEGGAVALVMAAYTLWLGRWRVGAAFAGILATLTLASVVMIGFWFPDYQRRIADYTQYADTAWPPMVLNSPLLAVAVILAIATATVLSLRHIARHRDAPPQPTTVMAVVIVVILLLMPQSGNYSLTLLLLPLLSVFGTTEVPLARLGVLAAVVSPWGTLLVGNRYGVQNLELLLVPALAGAALLLHLSAGARHGLLPEAAASAE